MILIGQLDSPFVRRVAIALYSYGIAFKHTEMSAYGDFGELLTLNPLGKVPVLQLDDGTVLADSTLILDHIEHEAGKGNSLWPEGGTERAKAVSHTGVALGLAEKAVEFRTETVRRPADKQDQPRVERVRAQIAAALEWLEKRTPGDGFLFGEKVTHADIMSAAALTFIVNKNAEHLSAQVSETKSGFESLLAHRARCEQLKAFFAAPFKDY